MPILWVGREAVGDDPLHGAYEAIRQVFILKLAEEYGLEQRETLKDGVYVDCALHGSADQIAAFLKRLARRGMGRFVVDVEEGDKEAIQTLEEANQVLAQELQLQVAPV